MKKLTWKDLVKIEPTLSDIAFYVKELAKESKQWNSFCANDNWYRFKTWIAELVGWHAKDKRLANRESYDIAYDHIYNLLPNCRDCNCEGSREENYEENYEESCSQSE